MSNEEWQGILETALTGVFQDIKTVEVMQVEMEHGSILSWSRIWKP